MAQAVGLMKVSILFLAQCACFVWMVCLLSVNVLVRMFVEVCVYINYRLRVRVYVCA